MLYHVPERRPNCFDKKSKRLLPPRIAKAGRLPGSGAQADQRKVIPKQNPP